MRQVVVWVLTGLLWCGCAPVLYPGEEGVDPGDYPTVVEESHFQSGVVPGCLFCGRDWSSHDLSRLSLEFLARSGFDDATLWPPSPQLPAGFSPVAWLEQGKNPGLGLRTLHEEGISGSGVVVAVVGRPFRASHRELRGRLVYLAPETAPETDLRPHAGGLACASLLAGATTGVAPASRVHYFAHPGSTRETWYQTLALQRIQAINETVPPESRIRVVVIAQPVATEGADAIRFQTTRGALAATGVAVLSPGASTLEGFVSGGCPPSGERGRETCCPLPSVAGEAPVSRSVLVPGDYRTVASNRGDKAFLYRGCCHPDSTVPTVAGLLALGWQVAPQATLGQLLVALRVTARPGPTGFPVISPDDYLEAVGEARAVRPER